MYGADRTVKYGRTPVKVQPLVGQKPEPGMYCVLLVSCRKAVSLMVLRALTRLRRHVKPLL